MSEYRKSYGRQALEQAENNRQQIDPEKQAQKAGEQFAQFLGFVASQHKDAIIHDIYTMLSRNTIEQLDGYILALARCMSHDLAWHCINEAFQKANTPIPEKYYTRFNKKRQDDNPIESNMKVE